MTTAPRTDGPSVLFVANFPAGTGYAWNSIEAMFAGVAERLAAAHGLRTFVSYPAVHGIPENLAGTAARVVALDASFRSLASVRAVRAFVRREDVRIIYLTDRPVWHVAFPALRGAGVGHIVVHDRTSGHRDRPRGWRWAAKWLLVRTPGLTADTVVAVSDYIAHRQVAVRLLPVRRVVTIWNGVPAATCENPASDDLRTLIGAPADRLIIAAASRAVPEKGIAELMHAFDALYADWNGTAPQPILVFVGDGPSLAELQALRSVLPSRDAIHLVGYQPKAAELVGSADIAVVPSLWQEAFGNSVIEAMARGRAVVATRVGGIPEIIEDGVSGWLVDPGDVAGLTRALRRLVDDPELRAVAGLAARERVATLFSRERQVLAVTQLLTRALDGREPPGATRRDWP
jgi:glycosyltransferase involved in cell wall biosynthesis